MYKILCVQPFVSLVVGSDLLVNYGFKLINIIAVTNIARLIIIRIMIAIIVTVAVVIDIVS